MEYNKEFGKLKKHNDVFHLKVFQMGTEIMAGHYDYFAIIYILSSRYTVIMLVRVAN